MDAVFAEASVLDVDAAISAAELSELGRGLILAGMVIVLVALLALMSQKIGRLGNSLGTDPRDPRVPWTSVFLAGVAVAALGGAAGLAGSVTNDVILRGGILPLSGVASVAAIAVIAGILVAVFRRALLQSAASSPVFQVGGAVMSLALVIGVVLVPELPRPARSAEAHGTVTSTVQAVVSVIPGAAGSNTLRVGLSGSDEELQQLSDAVEISGASVTLTSLDTGEGFDPVSLSFDDRGRLVADGVEIANAGRWRVSLDLGQPDSVVSLDVTIQANPGYIR
jgi:hypothetical protein